MNVFAKWIALSLAAIIVMGLALGSEEARVDRAWGSVQYVDLEGGFWGILGHDGVRYLPLNLEAEFRQDGLTVRFVGRHAPEAATVAMWGTPVYVLEMQAVVVDRQLVDAQVGFAAALYAELRHSAGNLFVSPLSVYVALAMAYAGARGETEAQMRGALRVPDADQDAVHAEVARLVAELARPAAGHDLVLASAAWTQRGYPFLREYLDLVEVHYRATLADLDFARDPAGACAAINAWVEAATAGHIPRLLAPGGVDGQTRLVLTNAVYFRGLWRAAFAPEDTETAPFHLADGGSAEVPLMHRKGEVRYGETPELQLIELPYAGGEVAMTVLLPKRGESLEAVEGSFSSAALASWLSVLETQQVAVWLPRFSLTAEFELSDALIRMGIEDAFGPGADFSGMTGHPDLFISSVVHQAVVEVTEEGTVAAAATAVVMAELGLAEPSPEFRADRPFLFILRDLPTGTVLFLGRYCDPRAGGA